MWPAEKPSYECINVLDSLFIAHQKSINNSM